MILGVPVLGQYELTKKMLKSISETVANPQNFEVVLIDNGSTPGYLAEEYATENISVRVIRNDENKGFYYPLLQLYDLYANSHIIAMAHNDIVFYENGWDTRLQTCFDSDPLLGLVGLCGSWQADQAGGRGGGTMCCFRGEQGQGQSAGERITDLRPAMLLDSLFMAFRPQVIPLLDIDEHITPCHFYDKIWSVRTIEKGYRVAVLGTEIDHIGGQTSTGSDYHTAARLWCEKEGLPIEQDNPDLTVYLEAERRFLKEYRDEKHLIPGFVNPSYELCKI